MHEEVQLNAEIRYSNLINVIMAKQTPQQQFEIAKINFTFIYSLETSYPSYPSYSEFKARQLL